MFKCSRRGCDAEVKTKGRLCNPCNNAKAKRYRERHGDKLRAATRRRLAAYRERNRESWRARMNAWAAANRDRVRGYALKRRYGITLDQYRDLLKKQGGRCAVCRQLKKRTLHVDHDHGTGEVRGLLCDHCNRLLGFLGDTLPKMRKRVAVLEAYLRG